MLIRRKKWGKRRAAPDRVARAQLIEAGAPPSGAGKTQPAKRVEFTLHKDKRTLRGERAG
jgi:hypothetical protein